MVGNEDLTRRGCFSCSFRNGWTLLGKALEEEETCAQALRHKTAQLFGFRSLKDITEEVWAG